MQTDATTPNIVAPTMLGVVACVLAVVCKRTQQLPILLRQQCWELLANNVASFARGLKTKVGVVGSVAGWLLCFGVGTVHRLFNLLYDVIW